MDQKWYVVYTKPRAEKKVFQQLIDQGIDTFLPLIKTLKQWSDRKKWIEEPLFKSYIFVFISPNDYLKVLNIGGIVRFITFEGNAVPVPLQQIEAIREFISEPEPLEDQDNTYEIGDKVEIIRGPMAGLKGHLARKTGKNKVRIEIEAISQHILVSISNSYLRPA